MKTSLAAILCLTLTGLWAGSSPALAQQKAEKACRSEWQADKAANQAKGITEKAYVEQCRSAGAAAAAPITPAAAKQAPTVAAPAPAPKPATPALKPAPTAA